MTTEIGGEKTGQNTDALIDSLCAELKPCCRMRHPLWNVGPWVLFAFLYVIGAVYFQGFRIDIYSKLHHVDFVFELSLVAAMSVSAAFCAMWLCVPDMRGQTWMVSVPFTLFASLVLLLGLRAGLQGFVMPEIQWCFCYKSSLLYGLIPAFTIFMISVKGKTTHPDLLAFMVSLAVGGLGYLGLRLVCLSEDIGHILIIHTLPYFLFGLLAALIARRIYRW